MAGSDDARIFADACLWVQEAESAADVLRRANDAARLLLGTTCSYCAVRDGDQLRLVAHSGFRDPATARGWRLPVGQGIGGRVAVRGEVAVVRDFQHDPRRERFSKSLIDAEGLRCSICVPIRSGTNVVAVLYAAEHRPRRFTSSEVELMTMFARSASAALTAVEERQALRMRLDVEEELARRADEWRKVFAVVATHLASDSGPEAALGVLSRRLGDRVELRDPFGHVIAHAGGEGGDKEHEAVVPVQAGRRRLGAISVRRASPLDPAERAAMQQIAHLVSLWLLRERTALDDMLGPRFLDDLLHGRLGDEDAVARQAAILGLDMEVPRAVLCVGVRLDHDRVAPPVTRHTAEALRQAAQVRGMEPSLDLRGRHAVLLIRARDGGMQPNRDAIQALLGDVGSRLGGARLAGGLGRVCRSLRDYAESYREAELALDVACRSGQADSVRTHEDLGFYGMVAGAVEPEKLDALARHTLQPLLDTDSRTGSAHVATLAAFLRCDRHLKPAAAELHVHVNTLRYRLARIQQLLDGDLGNVGTRFQLEFALKIMETSLSVERRGGTAAVGVPAGDRYLRRDRPRAPGSFQRG